MKKVRLGVILGGMSTEHDVSIVSGTAVINNLNKEKYDIFPIYISKSGDWYKYELDEKAKVIGDEVKANEKIENVFKYMKNIDCVFPVLHGLYGEDGTIQGMLELMKKPYVGSKVLGSCVGMDKAYSKVIFEKANIPQAKYIYIRKYKNEYIYIEDNFEESRYELEKICEKITKKISFPMFIKPSNSGSSVGINKAKNISELQKYVEEAAKFDNKILIEENIIGREIECSVLGNEDAEASTVGEVLAEDEFYTYDAKYKNSKSRTVIPADLPQNIINEVRELAKKAYKAIDCKGLARVDFFANEENGEVYINEINTMPGFTQISMYPKLWEATGITYSDLLDKLINLAME